MAQLTDIIRLRAEERQVKRRNSLTELRKEFEARKREEWAKIRSEYENSKTEVEVIALRQQMARIMLELREQGVTKRQLGEAYGTKDMRTINELLDSAVLEEEVASISVVGCELEDVGAGFRVDATNYHGWSGTVFVYADEDGDPVIFGEPPADFIGTQLHREIAGGARGDFSSAWEEA